MLIAGKNTVTQLELENGSTKGLEGDKHQGSDAAGAALLFLQTPSASEKHWTHRQAEGGSACLHPSPHFTAATPLSTHLLNKPTKNQ